MARTVAVCMTDPVTKIRSLRKWMDGVKWLVRARVAVLTRARTNHRTPCGDRSLDAYQ